MTQESELRYKKCPFFNGEFCTGSFYEQSYCVGKCKYCEHKLEDYEPYKELYQHLFKNITKLGDNND